MLDIETTGTRAGCNVISIGICDVFNPSDSYYTVLGHGQGGFDEAGTLDFWKKQEGCPGYKEYDLYARNEGTLNSEKLLDMAIFIKQKPSVLWCKWASFDFPILNDLLLRYDLGKLPVKHTRQLCMATILVAKGKYRSSFGAAHSAILDAIKQSAQLKECFNKEDWRRLESQL
jgi:hypothetical protein